jgi:hypothetical protein
VILFSNIQVGIIYLPYREISEKKIRIALENLGYVSNLHYIGTYFTSAH